MAIVLVLSIAVAIGTAAAAPSATAMRVVLGQKSYSSWSLRAYLALRHCHGASPLSCPVLLRPFLTGCTEREAFQQQHVLVAGGFSSAEAQRAAREAILVHSPSGKVPALFDPAVTPEPIYDSLAIALYLHHRCPERNLFPGDAAAYAQCVSACAEMHSGFTGVRSNMPHNCVRKGYAHGAKVLQKEEVRLDIARLIELWTALRTKYAALGPYLLGAFSAADCAFAPVVLRLSTYDRGLSSLQGSPLALAYANTILENEYVREWIADAILEGPETKIAGYEAFCDPL